MHVKKRRGQIRPAAELRSITVKPESEVREVPFEDASGIRLETAVTGAGRLLPFTSSLLCCNCALASYISTMGVA